MPTKEQIKTVIDQLERQPLAGLSLAELAIATEAIDWQGFSASDRRGVEMRIFEGEAAEFWADDIEKGNRMECQYGNPKTYQVWHSRSEVDPAEIPPAESFPGDYVHIADVQANSLREVVELTNAKGDFFIDPSGYQDWTINPEVRLVGVPDTDTTIGDIIVDPDGQAYRVEDGHFKEVEREAGSAYERMVQEAGQQIEETRREGFSR
jgi:hypothetical protein